MAIRTIENEFIRVSIKDKGAEWCSFQSVKTGKEYLWQADPAFWGRHAPILFPIIGEVANGEIHIGDNTYKLGRHGFVRDYDFEVAEQGTDFVKFRLTSNDDTRMLFPFEFALEVTYRLDAKNVAITYDVHNLQQAEIYFSIGAHPAMAVPLAPGEARSAYTLRFNQAEYAETQLLNDKGLRTTTRKVVLQNETDLPIIDTLFDEDALIFKGLKSNQVSLIDGNGKVVWTFDFTGFPYLGIWSKNRQAPFVCIEPWFGVADPVDPPHAFQDKEGILRLQSDRTFSCTHAVTLHEA